MEDNEADIVRIKGVKCSKVMRKLISKHTLFYILTHYSTQTHTHNQPFSPRT